MPLLAFRTKTAKVFAVFLCIIFLLYYKFGNDLRFFTHKHLISQGLPFSHSDVQSGKEDSGFRKATQHINPGQKLSESAIIDAIADMQQEIERLKTQLRSRDKTFPPVQHRSLEHQKRILITGGAGFVGSHLVDRLMESGHRVVVLDNEYTGTRRNVEHWVSHPNFEFKHEDVVNPISVEGDKLDQIYHLASPASPAHYMFNPVKTLKSNIVGTMNVLGLARRTKATVLLASTSEVYGDPEIHPQPESYWGHVNPVGPRSCYDEGKRAAESLMVAYHKQEKIAIRIARIFNTFGPRMHVNDGRVVSNFILQALKGEPITVYGTGEQTRSFQYVSDLVDGLIALMNSNETSPVNLGNPEEHKITDFARIIRNLTDSKSEIVHVDKAEDDPQQRRPDIQRAWNVLKWKPKVPMVKGLEQTITYFREVLKENIL